MNAQTGEAVRAGRAGRFGQLRAGDVVDPTLAAIATLTAAWPISTLLAQTTTWLGGTVLLLAVIVVAGIGARSFALRGWQVLTVQLVCAVLAAGALYGRGHLWHGLPTFDTARFANTLILEAVDTAQKYSAPAPATPGLVFVIGSFLGLVALLVDYLAVTRRTPSLAGLPLLTVFLAAVANRGSTLPVIYFLAAAGMWLILVARAGSSILRWWGTTVTVAEKPVPYRVESSAGVYEHASAARVLGAAALVAAVTLPVILPQLPPTFLLSGLGRVSTQPGTGSNTVAFSQSLDLATDLQSRSRAPVLQYTTPDASPPPLQVSLGATYRPEPGLWLPFGRQWQSASGGPDLSVNPSVPDPTGLSPDVPRRNFVMDVRRNLLEDPYLATPYPLVGADLGGVAWGADQLTQSVRVAERPESYKASYLHLNPTAQMLRSAPPLSASDQQLYDFDLRLDGPYVDRVSTLTETLTRDKGSSYDKAMAIQEYLRADGGFTYSLTLAPPATDPSGNIAGYDSLTNFLVTKRGYCVQFATAMVMMSRAAGIPARMAIGFLPGTESRGVWTVLAADAHAWPELYLEGVGWTRFEPTPSRGAPPPYATPAAIPGIAPDGTPLDTATTPAPSRNERPDLALPGDSGASPEAGLSASSVVRWATHGWGPVLLGAILLLLGPLVVPLAARWRRRRSLRSAATSAAGVEVRWELLTSSLGDLGIPPAPSRTPRQLHAHYDKEASLEEPASLALGRVVQTLERSRYAVSAPATEGLEADTREVFRAAAANRRGRDRLRAVLWPSSGVMQLRSAGARAASRLRAGQQSVSNLARRLSPRRKAP
jgi:transglutaminase-like putative cysteine protease